MSKSYKRNSDNRPAREQYFRSQRRKSKVKHRDNPKDIPTPAELNLRDQ